MDKTIFTDFRIVFFISLILLITIVFAWLFNYISNKYIRKLMNSNHFDATGYIFAKKIFLFIIYVVGISLALAQIPEMKIVGKSMLAGAGVVSLVIGMASHQALGNMVSGLLIVLFRPFKIGDRITIEKSYTGTVEEINLRHTIVKDFENNRIIVPNSVIGSKVIVNANMTETKVCKKIEIGVSYDADIDKALKIMEEEVLKHPLHLDNRSPEDIENNVPEVITRVVALADSSVNLKAWAYAETASKGTIMNSDLLKSIKERFDAEGIEIPYKYQNVIIKKEA